MYICICICVYEKIYNVSLYIIRIYIYIYICPRTNIFLYIYMSTYKHIFIYIHIYIYICTYMYLYLCTYIYIIHLHPKLQHSNCNNYCFLNIQLYCNKIVGTTEPIPLTHDIFISTYCRKPGYTPVSEWLIRFNKNTARKQKKDLLYISLCVSDIISYIYEMIIIDNPHVITC